MHPAWLDGIARRLLEAKYRPPPRLATEQDTTRGPSGAATALGGAAGAAPQHQLPPIGPLPRPAEPVEAAASSWSPFSGFDAVLTMGFRDLVATPPDDVPLRSASPPVQPRPASEPSLVRRGQQQSPTSVLVACHHAGAPLAPPTLIGDPRGYHCAEAWGRDDACASNPTLRMVDRPAPIRLSASPTSLPALRALVGPRGLRLGGEATLHALREVGIMTTVDLFKKRDQIEHAPSPEEHKAKLRSWVDDKMRPCHQSPRQHPTRAGGVLRRQ